jgi:hypothetical protein
MLLAPDSETGSNFKNYVYVILKISVDYLYSILTKGPHTCYLLLGHNYNQRKRLKLAVACYEMTSIEDRINNQSLDAK